MDILNKITVYYIGLPEAYISGNAIVSKQTVVLDSVDYEAIKVTYFGTDASKLEKIVKDNLTLKKIQFPELKALIMSHNKYELRF